MLVLIDLSAEFDTMNAAEQINKLKTCGRGWALLDQALSDPHPVCHPENIMFPLINSPFQVH